MKRVYSKKLVAIMTHTQKNTFHASINFLVKQGGNSHELQASALTALSSSSTLSRGFTISIQAQKKCFLLENSVRKRKDLNLFNNIQNANSIYLHRA